MKSNFAAIALLSFIASFWTVIFNVGAGTPQGADLIKAKKEAESRGYGFLTSRDEIVRRAKEEGKLRVSSSNDPDSYPALRKAFMKQYPFIDVSIQRSERGPEGAQRLLMELQAMGRSSWDVTEVAAELYQEYMPHVKKLDILGMAKHGILQIPTEIIDPKHRNIVSLATTIHSIAYNKNLIALEKVPNAWEDFVKPELKGRKFMALIRPLGIAALAPGLGQDWAIAYARKIKEQDPVWVQGTSRAVVAITTAEQTLLHLPYYHSCVRAQRKDATKSLECKIIEPVPVRIQELTATLQPSPYPHAALLWLEFLISPTGQAITHQFEPKSSIFVRHSEAAKLVEGKKLSVIGWENFNDSIMWEKKAYDAFGLPQAVLQ